MSTEAEGDPAHVGWRTLAGLALAQSAAVVVLTVLWIAVGTGNLEAAADVLEDAEFWMLAAALAVGLHVLQAFVLWPVRRTAARRRRGASIVVTITVASILVALLAGGFVLALTDALRDRSAESGWAVSVPPFTIAVAWPVAWVLFRRFLDASPNASREDLLARIARHMLVGTVFEALAIIPLDVMLRRKTDCYCFAGTLFAWGLCLAVGLVVLGPAVLLPVLARRRAGWYAARCDDCGERLEMVRDDYRALHERCARCGDTVPRDAASRPAATAGL